MAKKPQTRSWLIEKNKQLFWPLLILVIMSAILSFTAVLFAFVSKLTIDAAQFRNERIFFYSALAIVVILIFQILFRALYNYLTVYWQSYTDKHLKGIVFADILKKKQSSIDQYHSGELMNYLQSDVDKISHGLIEIIPRFVFLILRFLFAFILLFLLDLIFAGIMLVFGVMLFVISIAIRNEIRKRHNAMQDAEARLRSFMQEGLEHLVLIKSFEAESYTKKNLSINQTKFVKAKLSKHRISILAGTALQGFFSAGYAFAIIFGAYKIGMNALTFGSLIAILQVVEFMQAPFAGLSTLIPKYYAMLVSSERIMALENLPKEEKTRFEKITGFEKIVFKDVSFKYDQAVILQDFNLVIPKETFVHIKGESGIGKTTLFKILLGLIDIDEGEANIDTTLEAIPCSENTRQLFTYVPQGLMIQSGTLADNIIYNQKNIKLEDLRQVAHVACILDEIDALPLGFQTKIGERGYGLSEGQVQRLAIARALLKDAPILLLDEITSALDEETEHQVLSNIKALTDKTCLIISHRQLAQDLIDQTIKL